VEIAGTLVEIRLQGIELAQDDFAFITDLQLSAGATGDHDAFDRADAPQLTFIVDHRTS
jgi:hypothetical protein